MLRIFILVITTFISLLIIISCGEENFVLPAVDETNNGFESKAIAEIFAENCSEAECHGDSQPQHNLRLTKYSEMIKGSSGRSMDHGHGKLSSLMYDEGVYGGSPVIPFNAEKSLMYNLLIGNIEDQNQRMPYQRNPLSESDINLVKEWINNGARDFKGNIPYTNSSKVFVCNQGSDEIFEIDTEYMVVSRIIDVDLIPTLTDAPHNVQVRNGYYYVTLIASGRFLKISQSTNQIVGQVDGIEYAGMIQITKDGKTAFVSRSSTAPGIYSFIYAIDTETMSVKKEISLPVTGLPHAIWLSADEEKLYVGNMTKDRIHIVDVASLEVIEDDIDLPNDKIYEPMHLYVSPDNNYLYLNCRTSSTMLIISTATKTILQELVIQNHPMQSAISKDGEKIYTVSHHEPVITEITKSGESWSITKEFTSEAFHHLYGADLSPDGKYLYATCANNDPAHEFEPHYKIPGTSRSSLVCVYDVETGELVKVIDVGSFATGIAAREN